LEVKYEKKYASKDSYKHNSFYDSKVNVTSKSKNQKIGDENH
jgi:hypothetical protein